MFPDITPSLNNKTGSWRTFRADIDPAKCVGCERCHKLCPEGCIAMVLNGSKKLAEIDYDYCKGCGLCAEECPVKAISMSKQL
jgi:2-oxoacid:acceptor oxidoreductase delta subunit (pyruvate/2-ketoisovalerate family)